MRKNIYFFQNRPVKIVYNAFVTSEDLRNIVIDKSKIILKLTFQIKNKYYSQNIANHNPK